MDGVLGRVEVSHIHTPQPQIRSHGRWPVKKLQAGQTIRFKSRNYENLAIMKVEKLRWFDQMVIVSGSGIEAAFGLGEMVELVSVEEVRGHAG